MGIPLLGLVALLSLIFVLAGRYRAGRQHPPSLPDGPDRDSGRALRSPSVSVYGEECAAVRTAGGGLYVTGNGVVLMEDDTIRVDGRSFTVTEIRSVDRGRAGGALIVGLEELP